MTAESWVTSVAPPSWGDWRLGDLSDALTGMTSLLGPATTVNGVAVDVPAEESTAPPRVTFVVSGPAEVTALRDRVVASGELDRFVGKALDWIFCADVAGVHLRVFCTEGDR